jgi:cytosine/adenosine deaminase-related metal-dependent hydrolase
MSHEPFILRARHVAPIASPTIADGAVRVEGGGIVDFGPFADLDRTDARVDDLGEVVLMPGLINAHVHLELSHAAPGEPPASFGEWLLGVVTRRNALPPEQFAAAVASATRDGAAECLCAGVTCVGDISRECRLSRAALRRSPLRVVSFGEVQALAQRRVLLEERLAAAVDATDATERLTIGISPHAPYTVEPAAYRRCVAVARERGLPICTHLAESPEEAEFLNAHAGPLRTLWERLGTWDNQVPRWAGTPVEFARDVGLLGLAPLLAHVNYASDADLATLAASDASVCWCPRTHAYFGHVPHRWREMLARGINVCVGTDSRASSPSLDVVEDLRLVHRQAPEVDAQTLWSLVTTRAARALRREDIGAIERGRRADFVAFESRSDDPLRELIEESRAPTQIWIDGERV